MVKKSSNRKPDQKVNMMDVDQADESELEAKLRNELAIRFPDTIKDDFTTDDQSFHEKSTADEHTVPAVIDRSKLSKPQRKRLKKKEERVNKREAKQLLKASNATDQELPTSSSIVLTQKKNTKSVIDTDDKRLEAARARLTHMNDHLLNIRPVPLRCPPGLLKDLCPLAIGVRFPMKSGARFAFLQFRNESERQAALQLLSNKQLCGKPICAIPCVPGKQKTTSETGSKKWRKPNERELTDFDWKKLFVTNLPRRTTRFDLGQVFRKASSIELPTYDDGSTKGACLLTYRLAEDALEAFESRHGTFIRGSPIYVNFALRSKSLKKSFRPDAPTIEDVEEHLKTVVDFPTTDVTVSTSSASAQLVHKLNDGEFHIDRTPTAKVHTTSTNKRDPKEPKSLSRYQLNKTKGNKLGSSESTSTPLDLLMGSKLSKPKHSKKVKRLTKRGKQSKHR